MDSDKRLQHTYACAAHDIQTLLHPLGLPNMLTSRPPMPGTDYLTAAGPPPGPHTNDHKPRHPNKHGPGGRTGLKPLWYPTHSQASESLHLESPYW
jgi:hypothetical protein